MTHKSTNHSLIKIAHFNCVWLKISLILVCLVGFWAKKNLFESPSDKWMPEFFSLENPAAEVWVKFLGHHQSIFYYFFFLHFDLSLDDVEFLADFSHLAILSVVDKRRCVWHFIRVSRHFFCVIFAHVCACMHFIIKLTNVFYRNRNNVQEHFVTDYSICSNDLYLVYHLFSDSFYSGIGIVYSFNGSRFLFASISLWVSRALYERAYMQRQYLLSCKSKQNAPEHILTPTKP